MDFQRLDELAAHYMRERHAHLEREIGSVYFHGKRVATGVVLLRARVTRDDSHDDILRAAAMFHDIGKGIEPHPRSGAALARELLREEIEPGALSEVARLIAAHADRRPGSDAHDVWARLLQDADLLDHFGSYEVWMGAMATSYHFHASLEELNRYYAEQYAEQTARHRAKLNFPESLPIFDEKDAFSRAYAERLRVESAGGYCV